MMNPLVSIIIPVYNGSASLKRAIASVIRQTYARWEAVVVDDCSTEDIESVVRAQDDPRIIYIRHSKNQGAAAARNTGIRKAQGDMLVFLDSDDEYVVHKIARQLEVFQSLSQDAGMIMTNLQNAGADLYVDGKVLSGYVSNAFFPGSVFSPPSTWMLRPEIINQTGFFDEEIFIIEDADFFVRVLEKFPVYFLNEALSIKHASTERKGRFPEKYFLGKERFLEKNLSKMKKDKKYFSKFFYTMGKDYEQSRRPDRAAGMFLKAFCVLPKPRYFIKYLKTCFFKSLAGNNL